MLSKRFLINFLLIPFIVIILGIGVFAGFYGRFAGLSNLPFSVDEYYFVSSVNRILERGIPEFSTGGYYVRGIILQYLTAFSALIFGQSGFGYRLPTVIFSLGSVILIYFYSRMFFGRILAGTVALALLVSSWNIEFARFARMYSAFQFTTLLFFILATLACLKNKWHLRYLPHMAALLAAFTHALSLFLIPFLFLPIFNKPKENQFPSSAHRYRYALISMLTAIFCFLFSRFPFRNLGVTDRLPSDYIFSALSSFNVPEFPFWSFHANPFINLWLINTLIILTGVILWICKHFWKSIKTTDIISVMLIVSTALHSFIISLVCAALLLFRCQIYKFSLHPKRTYIFFSLSCVIGISWIVYALFMKYSYINSGGTGRLFSGMFTFFGWPDWYHSFYHRWSREFPLICNLLIGAIIYQVITKLKKPFISIFLNPAFIVIYIVMALGIFHVMYTTSRYTFFIYPLILVTITLSLNEFLQLIVHRIFRAKYFNAEIVSSLIFLCLFLLSSDFNPKHIMNITSNDVAFRMHKFDRFKNTWYLRYDVISPANYLNQQADKNKTSRIIVVDQPPLSYYLLRDHAVYYDRSNTRFTEHSRVGGSVDLWSNKRLLSTENELKIYTAPASTVWIVRYAKPFLHPFSIKDVWRERLKNVAQKYLSADGQIEVIKINLSKK